MRNIQTYEDWLEKQKSNGLVHDALTQLEPIMAQMFDQAKAWYLEKYEHEMDEYDEVLYRLSITRDMVNSFETYAAPTDKLIQIDGTGSPKGTIKIKAKIRRDDQDYYFSTDVIYAGGYNIQRLHYRYITKSELPKIGNFEMTRQLDAQIKALSKAEKIKQQIDQLKQRIKFNEKKIAKNKSLTDDQIIDIVKADKNENFSEWPSWEELGKRGAQKNYNNDREDYEKQKAEYIPGVISFWKKRFITWTEENTVALYKELKKLETKLDTILNA
jgi:hypothetical protein